MEKELNGKKEAVIIRNLLQFTNFSWGVPSSHCKQLPIQGTEMEESPLVIEWRNL